MGGLSGDSCCRRVPGGVRCVAKQYNRGAATQSHQTDGDDVRENGRCHKPLTHSRLRLRVHFNPKNVCDWHAVVHNKAVGKRGVCL